MHEAFSIYMQGISACGGMDLKMRRGISRCYVSKASSSLCSAGKLLHLEGQDFKFHGRYSYPRKKLPLKVIEISNKDMSSRKCLFYFLKIPEYSWKLSGGLLNNVAIFSWSRAIPSWFLLFVASLYLLNHRLWLVQKTPFFR